MPPATFQEFRSELLDLCLASIRHGVETGQRIEVDTQRFDPALQVWRATFVTLLKYGGLRGCIGSLNAMRPLVVDLARNAYAAAFSDPRFERVEMNEIDTLEIHISILSEPEAMSFRSESDLLSQLQPGIDGLVLEDHGQQGTFLPSVWESLPDPRDFLNQLKRKAGLAEDYWSKGIKISRYTTEIIYGRE
ncbi:MAG: AmmeMemoRadiSam system protein A [Methylococcales bacterium]